MSTQKNPRRNPSALIQEFLSRHTTQKAFCHEKGIALSTLQYWLRRHRHQQSNESTPVFIPLAVSSAPEVDSRSYGCVIEYPSGVTIRFSGPVNITLLTQLVLTKGI
jgi:hypothetical protein